MKSYDAIVIGAGPAGATAALLLARAGWSVALLEKARFPRRKVCGEFISATSLPLLTELGVAQHYLGAAGPAIRRVGLYAGKSMLAADMPGTGNAAGGRALGREHLDTLLLRGASAAGAALWQPWALTQLQRVADGYIGTAVAQDVNESAQLKARVVIAAHGSWERGVLPTQSPRQPARAADLFAFKAHFQYSNFPLDLMPLLVFPGGYGGMVLSDGGRASLSCCIRRDALATVRRQSPHLKAAAAVFAHIVASCRGVAEGLADAACDGEWLAAGPIRPGIRVLRDDGIFAVGNAAGEAHPIVAEGISMAMQSASLLCERLIACRDSVLAGQATATIAQDYAAAWRGNFARRIYAAAVFAQVAMRPASAELALAVLKRAPQMLTFGAYLSGKVQPLRSGRNADTA